MKKIYYEKVGRKYVPVSEYDSDWIDSFKKGTHVIMSYPGGSSRRYNIDPAFAPMIAAGRFAEDAISKVIMDTSALRVPEKRLPLTPEQQQAWEALAAALGEERFALEWCSYREAAEAGVKAMQQEADKMLHNPAVKKAWDYFMMVWNLAKEESFEDH
jgi:hypothetical protein